MSKNSCDTGDRPRVIVFDLDGTLWDPEMYQLSGGAPFRPDEKNPDVAIDRINTKVSLIGETRNVLQDLIVNPKWKDTYLAISSTCDMPEWAESLLDLYKFKDTKGKMMPMVSLFSDRREIYYAGKDDQHKRILMKVRQIDKSVNDFSQMLFFDNQRNNVSTVSKLGVTCYYCPQGLVPGTFQKGLELWQKNNLASL
ncbi:unnamed protein product [Phytomonas sp. Hart1]|nr:unnamed protein product [Phytomonas sp. Hart1]|eukprot:CCW71471.1 unnamed protein product [Phytomonas sp. isolate Hart1]